uniref:GDP-mannose pyrophosphatase n=1 Tax=Dictyoglomus thermophilum TaxID=14 RepID=A0A7C3RJ33_DICTH
MNEKVINEREIYKGRIITVKEYDVVLENGKLAKREVVHHPGAVAILPIARDGSVFFVEQYRLPAKKVLLEIPAGKLDFGEEPINCAKRELEEEIGYIPKNLKLIHVFYPSPGISDEVLYLYEATDLEKTNTNPDDDEFLKIISLTADEIIKALESGKFEDSKTLIAIYYFLRSKKI